MDTHVFACSYGTKKSMAMLILTRDSLCRIMRRFPSFADDSGWAVVLTKFEIEEIMCVTVRKDLRF